MSSKISNTARPNSPQLMGYQLTQVSYILFKRRIIQPQEGRGHSTINYTETQILKTLLLFYGLETLRTLTKS